MLTVQRGNVVLDIDEQDKDYYVGIGYNVIDAKGNIIEKSLPKDVGLLTKLYIESQAEIDKYKKQIDDLKKEIKKLKKKEQ